MHFNSCIVILVWSEDREGLNIYISPKTIPNDFPLVSLFYSVSSIYVCM